MGKRVDRQGKAPSSMQKGGLRAAPDWARKSELVKLGPLKSGVRKPAVLAPPVAVKPMAKVSASAAATRAAAAQTITKLHSPPAAKPTLAPVTATAAATPPGAVAAAKPMFTRKIPRKPTAAQPASSSSSSTPAASVVKRKPDELSLMLPTTKKASTMVPTVNSSMAAASKKATKKVARKLSPWRAGSRKPAAAADGGVPPAAKLPATRRKLPKRPLDPVVATFAPRSTGGRYRNAAERDEARAGAGTIGKSVHAFERQARNMRRAWRNSENKASVSVDTPYGPVTLSKFPTRDRGPKISTTKEDYGNASVGHKYSELVDAFVGDTAAGGRKAREQAVARELLGAIKTGKRPADGAIADGRQSNAAAKFMAIMTISEPERVGGSSKHGRSVLRAVEAGDLSFHEGFVGDERQPPRFLMAETPNTARRALGKGSFTRARPPAGFYPGKDPHFSDSSDDDT